MWQLDPIYSGIRAVKTAINLLDIALRDWENEDEECARMMNEVWDAKQAIVRIEARLDEVAAAR